ncbi:hypothetical protein [Variovorax sp. EL159]|uniref:AbiJ-related protein n=1 Tax=Variovorax sp. EL159 TaxID=1566270 RepID=UPI00088C89CC|nr:hypothetical protein [Variovorax sp. EL159]SCX71758.1 hypothetical protein SAMN03159363_3997 [Variovorax sp. EL159]
MDFSSLRALLRPFVGELKDNCTNTTMPEYCIQLGLPTPPEEPDKRSRLHGAFDALSNSAIPGFAQRLIDLRMLQPELRNRVQDLLWVDSSIIEIPKRSRRELARELQAFELFHHWENFRQLIQDVFVLENNLRAVLMGWSGGILDEVHKHFVRNPEDADVEALFDNLKAFDLSDKRFTLFLEGLVSADVQVDTEAQVIIVAAANRVLLKCGAELRQTGEAGGYPVFSVVALRSARGRPKNLIFASINQKPDIRLRDAVNNDIEIVSNPDDVLVYDRPLGAGGLSWRELQNWWTETMGEFDSDRAKKSLYRRLVESLPISSPPQRRLFESYFREFGSAIPILPALLPEVWLHWDPKTVEQRGAHALLTHRMDFLMLLPAGGRVVIEVDGVQHYAQSDGQADPRLYAHLAAGERELKLAGYEVYRFGGAELQPSNVAEVAKSFFHALFKRHGIAWH